MTEQTQNLQNDAAEGMEIDDIFGMISDKPEELKTDTPKKEKPAAKATDKPSKSKKQDSGRKFTFPFQLYAGSRLMDINGFFEDGKEYTGAEITEIMLSHDEYFFTSKIEYDYMADTNTVVAMSVQHKKG